MGLSAIEDAVLAWVVASTGLPAPSVILARQKAPQPATRPYITVRISPPHKPKSPHPLRSDQSFDASRPRGQEIEYRVVHEEYRVVSLQAYTDDTNGDACAPELLAAARRALGFEDTLAALRAVGLALLDPGDMQDLSALVETSFQGRAVLDVRFLAPVESVERVGYVATIGLTGEVDTPPDGAERPVLGPDVTVAVTKP